MGKISFGEINKSLLYILLMSISKVLNQYIYGFTYIKCFHTMNIYQFLYNGIIDDKKQNFPRHRVFDPFFSYIGVIFLSFIFIRYKKDENLNKILIPVSEGGSFHHSNLYLTLIYTKNKNYLKDKKGFLFYLGVIIMWIAAENLLLIYVDIFQDLDFWFFELIFVSFIFGKIFSVKINSHQKLGMAISIIVGSLLKIYNISLSLNSSTFYAKNHALISFCIFYFILIIMRSYVNTHIKTFLDLKYISHRVLLMSYGIIGALLCLFAGIFTSNVPCSEELRNYVCVMDYENKLYYDEIHNYIESSENMLVRLIVIILGMITFFSNIYYYSLIIKYYTPIHVIFSFPVQFFIEKTFLLIFTGAFYSEDLFTEKNQLSKFLLDISGDIASIIGFLIYLEIIELNFCNLNYNLKKNIIKRGEKDYIDSIVPQSMPLDDLFEDNSEEDSSSENNN